MVTFSVDDLKEINGRLRVFSEFLSSEHISDDDIFASKLVSCELLTNVIRHGGERAYFKGEILSDTIRITVMADCQNTVNLFPVLPDVYSESGRGLYIIRSVCSGDIIRGDDGTLTVYIKRT